MTIISDHYKVVVRMVVSHERAKRECLLADRLSSSRFRTAGCSGWVGEYSNESVPSTRGKSQRMPRSRRATGNGRTLKAHKHKASSLKGGAHRPGSTASHNVASTATERASQLFNSFGSKPSKVQSSSCMGRKNLIRRLLSLVLKFKPVLIQ